MQFKLRRTQREHFGLSWSQRILALRHGSHACGWPLWRFLGSASIVSPRKRSSPLLFTSSVVDAKCQTFFEEITLKQNYRTSGRMNRYDSRGDYPARANRWIKYDVLSQADREIDMISSGANQLIQSILPILPILPNTYQYSAWSKSHPKLRINCGISALRTKRIHTVDS